MAHAGNLDLVLGGVMDFNKTTTVGRALESWESCEIPLWSEFVTKSSINVVEFSCQHKIDPFVERIKSYVSKKMAKEDYLKIASIKQTFQFTINMDNTFQIANSSSVLTWTDGTSYSVYWEPISALEDAYANSKPFDPDTLNFISANEIAAYYQMLKPKKLYKKPSR